MRFAKMLLAAWLLAGAILPAFAQQEITNPTGAEEVLIWRGNDHPAKMKTSLIGGTPSVATTSAPGIIQPDGTSLILNGAVASANSAYSFPGVYNLTSANTPKLRACLGRGGWTGSTVRCRIEFDGDSTTWGYGSTGLATGSFWQAAYPTYFAAFLTNNAQVPASANGFFGFSAGAGSTNPCSRDSRVVCGSAWTYTSSASLGGYALTTSTAGNATTFTSPVAVDTFLVLYRQIQNGTNTMGLQIDSGTVTNVNVTSTAISDQVATVTGTVGTHTLSITSVAGQVVVSGIFAYNSTVQGIDIYNAGYGTSSTSDWTVPTAASGPMNSMCALSADVHFIDMGVNDWYNGFTVSGYQARLAQMIAFAKACPNSPDVIVTSPTPTATASIPYANQLPYVAAAKAAALAAGVPFIDVFNMIGTWEAANTNGLEFDNLHPNGGGYRAYASNVYKSVMQVVGP